MSIFKAFFAFMLPVALFANCHVCHVGPLNHDGIVVQDLSSALGQWQAGTGNQFRSTTTNTYEVRFRHLDDKVDVTLQSSFSELNAPFIELVQASPAIGPWAPQEDNGKAPVYLGYAVSDVKQVGESLEKAGLDWVAKSGSKFAFYRGVNGVLIKLVRLDQVPPSAGTNNPQAPLVFGAVHHTNVNVYDFDKVKKQLGKALHINWIEPSTLFPGALITYAGIGVVATDVRFISSATSPLIFVGEGSPRIGGFIASPTTSGVRIVYNITADLINSYRDQLLAAGFATNSSVEFSGVLINGIFTAPQGYWIELNNSGPPPL